MYLPETDEQGRFKPNMRTGGMIKRVFAKLIDSVLTGITTFGFTLVVPVPVASFIGVSWFVLSDWLGSPGKWLFQLRAVTLTGEAIGPVGSLQRNLLLGLPTFLRALVTSGLIGVQGDDQKWDLGILGCLSTIVVFGELIGMAMQPENRRWGDMLARSRVVDR